MKTLILLGAITLSNLLTPCNQNVNTGTVTNAHYITFDNSNEGYYTEHELANVGDDVIVVGDMMIVDGSITYLK